jgi:hypothetical protein
MEILFGPYGVKFFELAHHYPSTTLIIALAVLAARPATRAGSMTISRARENYFSPPFDATQH